MLLHLLLGDVADVGGEIPQVAKGILRGSKENKFLRDPVRLKAQIKMGPLLRDPMVLVFCFYFAVAVVATPACPARADALSVASQVNSASVRPKWPYAAVCL